MIKQTYNLEILLETVNKLSIKGQTVKQNNKANNNTMNVDLINDKAGLQNPGANIQATLII